jgi:DNA modification methylase
MPELQVEYRFVDSLIPYARNARTHSDEQVAQIAASIREFGFNNPILVDGHKGVIAGHGRILAARKLNLSSVPVIELSHLSEIQKRAFILTENKLTERGGWDSDLLSVELADLQEAGFDLELTGFDDADLQSYLDPDAKETSEDPDESSVDEEISTELPAKVISRLGDVWKIGGHRLICGDSTDHQVVLALMEGQEATLCFTSPPYASQREYTGDAMDWDELMRGVFSNLPLGDGAQLLVNLGLVHRDGEVQPYWDDWIAWMQATGWKRFAWYVWDQGPGLPGDFAGRLAPSFEFIFHFNQISRKPNKIVPCKFAGQEVHLKANGTGTAMRGKDGSIISWSAQGQPTQDFKIPDSVIRVTRHKGQIGKDIDHPAVFPVALPEMVMQTYTDKGDVVYEPFCGSGTSLLAAEKTGRSCRAVEISPQYVDVAIRRFLQHYPEASVALVSTGQSFEEVQAQRLGVVH